MVVVSIPLIFIVWSCFDLYRQRKARPPCHKCKSRRYYRMVAWPKEFGIDEQGIVLQCDKCKERYLQTLVNFFQLEENNRPIRYMKRIAPGKSGKLERTDTDCTCINPPQEQRLRGRVFISFSGRGPTGRVQMLSLVGSVGGFGSAGVCSMREVPHLLQLVHSFTFSWPQ